MVKSMLRESEYEVFREHDMYNFDELENELQNDEINPEEEGFMRGYLQSEI